MTHEKLNKQIFVTFVEDNIIEQMTYLDYLKEFADPCKEIREEMDYYHGEVKFKLYSPRFKGDDFHYIRSFDTYEEAELYSWELAAHYVSEVLKTAPYWFDSCEEAEKHIFELIGRRPKFNLKK